MKSFNSRCRLSILLALAAVRLVAAESPVDFEKARPLFEKMRAGQTLTEAEKAYVERARAERQRMMSEGSALARGSSANAVSSESGGATPDWPRIEALRQKELRGTISAGELRELYASLATIDAKQYPAEATRLALMVAGMAGDGGGSQVGVAPVAIAESESPILEIVSTAADGVRIEASYRKPPGSGPFPALMVIHGGLSQELAPQRHRQLKLNPVLTRLLHAGYVLVYSTFRTYPAENLQEAGPILDSLATFEAVQKLPFVDPASVVIFGGSGGGSLAFEIASRARPTAIVAGEPATILFSGMLTTSDYAIRLRMMGSPADYLEDRHRELIRHKIASITCPILILHGDIHPLKTMNHEIFIPALRAAGLNPLVKVFPHQGHGFYFGSGTSERVVNEVVAEVGSFLAGHLRTPPKASP